MAGGKARRKGGFCVFNVESDSLIERKSTGHAVTRSGNVLAWWLPFVCVFQWVEKKLCLPTK